MCKLFYDSNKFIEFAMPVFLFVVVFGAGR